MSRLSIVMPFYRNSAMLAEHYRTWAAYPVDVKAAVEVVIVDDGSPEPAADVPRPDGLPRLRIYRVLEDRPWHQHGARNLGARVADGPWLFMTDMDHVLPAASCASLLQRLTPEDIVYTFHRLDAPHLTPKRDASGQFHPHPNTFALTKAKYWKLGGYDEDCVGYGTDVFFRARLHPVVHLQIPVVRYSRDVIFDASTRDVDRDAARRHGRNQMIVGDKLVAGLGPTVLNFPWEQVL